MTDAEPPYRGLDALAAWNESSVCEQRILKSLALLPFAHARVLEPLNRVGQRGELATLYRALSRLVESGLVQAICPVTQPGRRPRLFYLTDLGLAATSLGLKVDAVDIARSRGLSRSKLLDRLPSLRPLLAAYDLLATLAWDAGGGAELAAWEAPWHRRVVLPGTQSKIYVSLPGYARLRWPEGREVAYFLLPDLGSYPVLVYGTALSRLTSLQSLVHTLPTLVIAATHDGRVRAWRRLLASIAERRGQVPLSAVITTWEKLQAAGGDETA